MYELPKYLPVSPYLSYWYAFSLKSSPLLHILQYYELSSFLGPHTPLIDFQGSKLTVSQKEPSRRLLHVAEPLFPKRVPLWRPHWKCVIAYVTKHPIIYLPIFCMMYKNPQMSQWLMLMLQRRCHISKNIKKVKTSRKRKGNKNGFIILQKHQSYPSAQGYLHSVFALINGV